MKLKFKFLAKLKTIGVNLSIPKLKEIVCIKFKSLVDVNTSQHYHIENSVIIIDPSRLKGPQRRNLQQMIRTDGLSESGAIVDESNCETVLEAIEYLPTIEATSVKFNGLIPSQDVPLLNACLFLRERFNQGETVEDLKSQIIRSYGTRGRNLANLASAGYLESVFLPVYDELLRTYPGNLDLVKAKFLEFYNTILNDLPWTEFVSGPTSVQVATARIVEKMDRNVQNGVRYLNIHALGKGNVQKVLQIVPEVQKKVGAITTRSETATDRIFVRLEIPPKALGTGQS